MPLEDQEGPADLFRSSSTSSNRCTSNSSRNGVPDRIFTNSNSREVAESSRRFSHNNEFSQYELVPKEPEFATKESRMITYESWPPGLNQKPRDLVEAGFYYTGYSDRVKCFFCGGGLEAWHEQDSVIGEHKKWFEDCLYIRFTDIEQELPIEVNSNTEIDISEQSGASGSKTQQKEDDKKIIVHKTNGITKTYNSSNKEIQDEIEELRYRHSCKVCLKQEVSTVLLPCNHLVVCTTCASDLENCPACGHTIEQIHRIYLS